MQSSKERAALERSLDPPHLGKETERRKKQNRDLKRKKTSVLWSSTAHFPRSQRIDLSVLSEEEKRERKREIDRKYRLKKKALSTMSQAPPTPMQDHLRSLDRPPTPAQLNAAEREAVRMQIMGVEQETRAEILANGERTGEALCANGADAMQALASANHTALDP